MVVSGWRAPGGRRYHGSVTSTDSSTRTRSSRSSCRTASRAVSASVTARRAAPTRLPASAFAAGGRAPISRLASASGDRSPVWSSLARLSSSRSPAAAIAARAASRARSTSSAFNGVTCTGSKDLLGADMGSAPSVNGSRLGRLWHAVLVTASPGESRRGGGGEAPADPDLLPSVQELRGAGGQHESEQPAAAGRLADVDAPAVRLD